jgi:KDO2-lipid IV(A) lauroyltransferase
MALKKRRRALRGRRIANAALGLVAVGLFRAIRNLNVDAMSDFAAGFMRRVGPWLPEHRIGRANLAAAFPEKSAAEIEAILLDVWDNLGRVGAEFTHIDRLWDYHAPEPQRWRAMVDDETIRIALRLRDDGKPALVFAAHLANWELAAVAATTHGIDTTVLYRRPNLRALSDAVIALRAGCMGTLIATSREAPIKLAEALQRGSHVAMLVDQYHLHGIDVTFFGRRTKANPMIARLARHFDCPIHGIRVIRHPGHRFSLQVTEAITPARDADGKIDIASTMQIITDVVERWVREHPEQWLWLHRRWRDK